MARTGTRHRLGRTRPLWVAVLLGLAVLALGVPLLSLLRWLVQGSSSSLPQGDLLPAVDNAYRAATRDLPTGDLTRELENAVIAHTPPLVRGRRIRLRYAHQGGRNPPVIVIHGNQTEQLPDAYRRYLVNWFRKAFRLKGTPVRLVFRTGENPYKGRRNKLTPRQERKRARLVKHSRG